MLHLKCPCSILLTSIQTPQLPSPENKHLLHHLLTPNGKLPNTSMATLLFWGLPEVYNPCRKPNNQIPLWNKMTQATPQLGSLSFSNEKSGKEIWCTRCLDACQRESWCVVWGKNSRYGVTYWRMKSCCVGMESDAAPAFSDMIRDSVEGQERNGKKPFKDSKANEKPWSSQKQLMKHQVNNELCW